MRSTADWGLLGYYVGEMVQELASMSTSTGVAPVDVIVIDGILLFVDERRLFWMLVPPIIFFVLFMGSQECYFGRWLMPVFPFVCVLAACGVAELVAARIVGVVQRRGREQLVGELVNGRAPSTRKRHHERRTGHGSTAAACGDGLVRAARRLERAVPIIREAVDGHQGQETRHGFHMVAHRSVRDMEGIINAFRQLNSIGGNFYRTLRNIHCS